MDDREPQDPGNYLGRLPELSSETTPGGVGPKDERVAGAATQSSGPAQRGANPDDGWSDSPDGHREAAGADDDTRREAGQNE